MKSSLRIAIIGGGAGGTLTALHLFRYALEPLDLVWFEQHPNQLNRGVAYSGTLPVAPLNVPVSGMSAYTDEPLHFYEWLKTHPQRKVGLNDFVARSWYGDYLQHLMQEAIRNAEQHQVHMVYGKAEEIKPQGTQWTVATSKAAYDGFDVVVCCTGNRPPQQLFDPSSTLLKGYISNPWNWNIRAVAPEEDILIIGTGLTMVDQVLSLQALGHRGKVYAISRNGFLPAVHAEVPGAIPPDQPLSASIPVVFEYLRNRIRNNPEVPWQYYLDGIRSMVPAIWQNAKDWERKQFLSRLKKYWEIHRHRIPLASAQALAAWQQTGQLKLTAGTPVRLQADGSYLEVVFRTSQGTTERISGLTYVLNCTGPDPDLSQDKTFARLFENGIAQPDVFKLGLKCTTDGMLMGKDHQRSEGLYCVGPLRKSEEWESTAIREIRTQAEALAKKVLGIS